MAEDAEVRSGMSSIIRLAKNLPLDIAVDFGVDSNGDGGDNKIVKRSPLSKKPNVPTEYLTSPPSKKRYIFLDSFGYN